MSLVDDNGRLSFTNKPNLSAVTLNVSPEHSKKINVTSTIKAKPTTTSTTLTRTYANTITYPIYPYESTPGTLSEMEESYAIIDLLDFDDVESDVIDESLLMHGEREVLIQELHLSERAYVESLYLIEKYFMQPLFEDTKPSPFRFLGLKKAICTEREKQWLFGNMTTIIHLHRDMLNSLEQRLHVWGPTQYMSDVLQHWIPRLEAYHSYFENYSFAIATYERLLRYQPFKKFIDTVQKEPVLNGRTLLSLLQTPSDRIHCYYSLLSKLADQTSPMHPDYVGLQICKQKMRAVFNKMRLKTEDAFNVNRTLEIHRCLSGAPFSIDANRRLVMHGTLLRTKAKRPDLFILFSDLLVGVRPRQDGQLQFKSLVHLQGARVQSLSEGYGFQILTPSHHHHHHSTDTHSATQSSHAVAHIYYAENEAEQANWINRLTAVIADIDQAQPERSVVRATKSTQHTSASIVSMTTSKSTSTSPTSSFTSTKRNDMQLQLYTGPSQ